MPLPFLALAFGGALLMGTVIGLPVRGTIDGRSGLEQPDPGIVIAAPSVAAVVAELRPYIDTHQAQADPLVPAGYGLQAKRSHVAGVLVHGVRYYYRVAHSMNHDPKSRGANEEFVTLTVLDPGTPWEVEIYRARSAAEQGR